MNHRVKPRKQSHSDFTGGMIDQLNCPHCGTTGELELDKQIHKLALDISGVEKPELLAEMITTAVRVSRGNVSYGDFKLMNRALKEMMTSSEIFHHYQDCRKVAVFGSARTDPDHPAYQTAAEFSRRMAEIDFMTITGAGPGIMAAGNEGAGRENSFGLNISLPFEASANEFIFGDEKLIDYNYFFTRKLAFVKEADALAAFPGGFGTMDEAFEALTLIQTGKARIYPTVLVDEPGGEYWKTWDSFVRKDLFGNGLISESDFALYKITDSIDEAVAEITQFYSNFSSYRYVGDQLIIRMANLLSDEALETLNNDFPEIIKAGKITQIRPEDPAPDSKNPDKLPRLVFRHKRRDYGRLRQFIDAVNTLAQ